MDQTHRLFPSEIPVPSIVAILARPDIAAVGNDHMRTVELADRMKVRRSRIERSRRPVGERRCCMGNKRQSKGLGPKECCTPFY